MWRVSCGEKLTLDLQAADLDGEGFEICPGETGSLFHGDGRGRGGGEESGERSNGSDGLHDDYLWLYR